MVELGVKHKNIDLSKYGIKPSIVNWNLTTEDLVSRTLELGQGKLNDTGALCVNTGKFTGRSPRDKFIVKDEITEHLVDWGQINNPISPLLFDSLYNTVCSHIKDQEIWVRGVKACADERYKLNILVVNETPWANLFCKQLFIRPEDQAVANFDADWLILQVPSFLAEPSIDGTRNENFTIVNFTRKIILIGGSAYTGEMKKGIFSVLNMSLPHYDKVLPMHCAANEGKDGDVALFFGLSGTGKTTLSTDPERSLIGDDEHGWAEGSIFNFEGGCYAKCINLTQEHEPQIYNAIKHGALVENTTFYQDSNQLNYSDSSITENTRVAYPIDYLDKIKSPSHGNEPTNIFFLSCDAFGVLPPIVKLSKEQAMYYFLSGYTAKVAGTEVGIAHPVSTFSACFGNVFLPLNPVIYANLLGEKLSKNENINVWMVNTGWVGGPYGVGNRIQLAYSRQLIKSAIDGTIHQGGYNTHSVFGFQIPLKCSNVPDDVLNPRIQWDCPEAYDNAAIELAQKFVKNFEPYRKEANADIINASPITVRLANAS